MVGGEGCEAGGVVGDGDDGSDGDEFGNETQPANASQRPATTMNVIKPLMLSIKWPRLPLFAGTSPGHDYYVGNPSHRVWLHPDRGRKDLSYFVLG